MLQSQNHHGLHEDEERRNLFCKTMMNQINNGEMLFESILFMYDATFCTYGEVYSQNSLDTGAEERKFTSLQCQPNLTT